MDIFLKISAGVLIAAVLSLVLAKRADELSLLLCLAVCSLVFLTALSYLQPVIEFVRRVVRLGNVNSELLQILLKSVGIGLLSQIVSLICEDVGKKSLSKALQITATTVILCISIPVLEQLLTLIELVLGGV